MNEVNEKTNTSVIDTEEKENLNEKIIINYYHLLLNHYHKNHILHIHLILMEQ